MLAPVLLVVLLLAAPAAGDPGDEKARVDQQLSDLHARIDEAGRRAGVLTSDLTALSDRVRAAEGQIASEEARLEALEAELASRRTRLAELETRIADQTARLGALGEQHAVALGRLEQRVREIYMTDSPDVLSVALGADSFADVIDNLELLERIGEQDEQLVDRVSAAERALTALRAQTRRDRAEAAEAERQMAAQTEEQRTVRDRVVAGRDALVAAQAAKSSALDSVRADKHAFLQEAAELEAQSAELAARIQAAQAAQAAAAASPSQTPSASGFVWPVSGPVVSGFGMRWGRMHEGIDIAVGFGVPVHAAASGTVIQAGWLGGYGNLVVIDHGNGLATAYAHNSSLAVSVGQSVSQGDVISYVGSTGHSSGPHVHFEVRVNGTAVDPLGYL
ncbi:MAG TPA: peptidoglycan DD-metalloendopeptidase family protein [Gaiellaceae bacterium]|nr:peptidoglycan DD-metalloendopeptidase family protein [Gaiellaceae bacterium]